MGISDRLRAERARLDLTQEQFGALGGVLKRAQINYEKGERSPDALYLAAIAAAGADVLYILTGKHSESVLSAEEQTLIAYYRDAPPAVRRAAMGALVGAAAPAAGGAMQTFNAPVHGQVAGRDMKVQEPVARGWKKKT